MAKTRKNQDFSEVRPGGLTEESDIRVLICFLLKTISSGLTRDQMDRIIWDDNRVSYFGYLAALDGLVQNGMLTLNDGVYTVTPAGIEASGVLENALPRAIRDAVLARAIVVLHREQIQNENSAEVIGGENGVSVLCRSRDADRDLMRLEFAADNRDIAQALAAQFMRQPGAVYRAAFYALTDDWEGMLTVAEELREAVQRRKKEGEFSV